MADPRKLAIAGLIGFTCAYSLLLVFAPERWLPREKLVLVVAEWCPKSLELQRQVAEDAELARRILVIDPEADLTQDRCTPIVQEVVEYAPWLHFEDDAWICRRIQRHVAALYREHFFGLPAWIEDGSPVARPKERQVLARYGITLCPGPRIHADETPCPEPPPRPRLVEVVAVERGRDIGL
ncbi:hypothetical protein [Paraliomyxa miuraensis]|uniref:hypothetical protein n=1 Tax=Paraliomyxa miuraensis TaxID=376150 RepID=UPI00224C903A|nr:hypothetical protein [Paraliomyxa miuraensis]MCX4240745.1 hypothetical protein [Paraliomyxa miuraensis]